MTYAKCTNSACSVCCRILNGPGELFFESWFLAETTQSVLTGGVLSTSSMGPPP